MPKLDEVNGSDDLSHDESKVEQDVHAKDQVDNELLDDVEETAGRAARAKAEDVEDEDEDESEGDEEEYEVEAILKHKMVQGVMYYQIHWKGYDKPKDYTWEPTDNLLPHARDKLAEYHHKIGGEPQPSSSIKKSKSTQPLRRQSSAEDSPAPKRRKADEDETWLPKKEDWEGDVDFIENIERDANGHLLVFIRFKNGKKIKTTMDKVYRHCPRPMLRFYENHLHFKSAEETEHDP